MATIFLEPGGDATFNAALTTAGGFWDTTGGTAPTIVTDFVHGNHQKSIKFLVSGTSGLRTAAGTLADAGGRISLYVYINTIPTNASETLFRLWKTGAAAIVVEVRMTQTTGVLKITNSNSGTQIGTDGATLSTGRWYRISLAYTITSTTVNRFELFVDGVSSISITNATITNTSSNFLEIGNTVGSNADYRESDIYVDNSSALTDPGNIWVTAKRPNANGTTNGFTTQIGSGGSGYGTGHSPQVNERALSNTNGWSMVGAGSAVTEEYNIEAKETGDIDISTATIIDWMGWADMKALAGETVQIILSGANNAQAITSTETLYKKIKGSATYPAGTGADIGITTDTSLTTVSLYECGIVVAYIPSSINTINNLSLLGVG